MSLSSLIVQSEVATMRQVEEALARQVIYGGDLVTNLMEVALIDERALLPLLADSMQLSPAPAGELPIPSDEIRALVPADVAIECGVLPLSSDGQTLVVAVAEILSDETMSELAATLGLCVEQRAAPLLRIRQAIARTYGVPIERRIERLVAKIDGVAIPVASDAPSARSPSFTPRGRSAPPRMNTLPLGVVAWPNRSLPTIGSGSVAGSRSTPPFGTNDVAAALNGPDRGQSLERLAERRSDRYQSGDVASAKHRSQRESQSPEESHISEPPSSRPVLLQRSASTIPRPRGRRRGPLTFAAVSRDAERATDRDSLLGLYFDFARQFFDYSALFIVHGEIAEGRDAFGTGAARERVVALGVPLDLPVPSLMSTARDTLRPAVARAPTDSLDAELRADLQLGAGGEMAVIPLVVRSRSVALVLGDCGDGGVDNEALEQIGACGTTIGRAFERLIIRKKKDGITPRFAEETPSSDAAAPMTQRSSALQVSSPQTGSDSAVVGSFFPAVQPSPFLSSPPPANIAVVRPLTGPPLPREEPEPLSAPGGAETSALETSTSSGIESLSSTSAALFHMQVARPEHADTPDASVALEHNIPSELDSGTLFDMLGWEGPGSDSDSPPPSEAHAVPPHRPPSARSGPPEEGLPSVIVDLDHELNVIVDRLIAGSTESERGEAEGELLRQGERAMRVIMARFPGPVNLDRKAIVAMAAPPKPSECGTLMRLVARERKVALPFVLERLSDPDPETRGWATYLLCELPYVEALPHLFRCFRDTDLAVQAAALHAIVAIGRIAPIDTRAVIREHARGLDAVERAAAMHVIGELRDQVLVPELVRALVDTHSDVVVSAHDALVQVSCQDFGADARPWVRWWDHHSTQHRIEWLIDALTHDVVEIRRAAAVELRGVTREYFGYSADLPLRDRERAQQRYRDWWATDGRTRFRNRREA